MKLLIGILAILTFSPIIRGLGNTLLTTDMSDLCKNESLSLTISDTLRRGIIASPAFRCIKIRGRDIQIEEGSFDDVPTLVYLDLADNEIPPSKLFSFGNLPSVRMLSLNNQISMNFGEETVIPCVYPYLEFLDLRHSGIIDIRSIHERPFPNLTRLDLSGNAIDQNILNFLPNTLVHLDLSESYLSSLRFNDTRNLLLLRLDSNYIEEISDRGVRLTGLEKLENLSIAYNRFSRINEQEFKGTPNLRYLDLSGNKLSFTHLNVTAYLPSLETLMLDSNSFGNVPLMAFSNITTLSLNFNCITHLTSSSFSSLPYLKRLHLSWNMIESVHVDTFRNQKLLEELHLDYNNLSYLPVYWCQYMKNLRYLNLAHNKFTTLESVIYCPTLPMLELHLEYNLITGNNSKAT